MTETKTSTEFDEAEARTRALEVVSLNHLGLAGERCERLVGDIVWERRHAWTDGFQAGIAAAMEAMKPLADAVVIEEPVAFRDYLPGLSDVGEHPAICLGDCEASAIEAKPLVSDETIRQAELIAKRYPDGINYVPPTDEELAAEARRWAPENRARTLREIAGGAS